MNSLKLLDALKKRINAELSKIEPFDMSKLEWQKPGQLNVMVASSERSYKTFPPYDLLKDCKTEDDFRRVFDMWYGKGFYDGRIMLDIEGTSLITRSVFGEVK